MTMFQSEVFLKWKYDLAAPKNSYSVQDKPKIVEKQKLETRFFFKKKTARFIFL